MNYLILMLKSKVIAETLKLRNYTKSFEKIANHTFERKKKMLYNILLHIFTIKMLELSLVHEIENYSSSN